MVQLYYLAVIRRNSFKPVVLCTSSDLSSFSFFQRGSVKEFMRFSGTVLVGRTEANEKVSVKEHAFLCHAYVREDNLSAVAITDDEYPMGKAHACLNYLLTEFSSTIPAEIWATSDGKVDFEDIKKIFGMFADSSKHVDSVNKVQKELDETKIVLHNTMENLLRRGEDLDELVYKTEELSTQAKAFYRTARKTNTCCSAL